MKEKYLIRDYSIYENNIKEFDRLSYLTSFRLWIDKCYKNKYVLPTSTGEIIITYKEGLFWIDGFMIGKIMELGGKRIFNLEYIHSFKKGVGTKMLLTYVNKHKIKNISYLANSGFDFWKKMKQIFKYNNIIMKSIGDKIEFQ